MWAADDNPLSGDRSFRLARYPGTIRIASRVGRPVPAGSMSALAMMRRSRIEADEKHVSRDSRPFLGSPSAKDIADVSDQVSSSRLRSSVVRGRVLQKCARTAPPAQSGFQCRPAYEEQLHHPLPLSLMPAPGAIPN